MMFGLFRKTAPDIASQGVPRSSQWESWLKKFLRGKSCIACGQTEGLTGHHVIPFHIDRSLELSAANVVAMCSDRCHLVHGHFNDYSLCNPTVSEDCSTYLSKRMAAKKS